MDGRSAQAADELRRRIKKINFFMVLSCFRFFQFMSEDVGPKGTSST